MSLVSVVPVTESRRRAAMREFVHSPSGLCVKKITQKDTPLGRNKWVTVRKRRQGLEDKTWQCAAAPRAPYCPAHRIPIAS